MAREMGESELGSVEIRLRMSCQTEVPVSFDDYACICGTIRWAVNVQTSKYEFTRRSRY